MQTLAAQGVLEVHTNIYDALRSHNLSAELIENPYGEPLAVMARGILDPSQMLGSIPMRKLFQRHNYDVIHTIADIIPISGATIYPQHFLDILDIVALAASDTEEGLATRLHSSPRQDDDEGVYHKKGKGSLGLHADFTGTAPVEAHPLYGLNAHITRRGSYTAKLGLLRNLDDDDYIWQIKKADEPDAELQETAAYERLAAPFTQPIEGQAGDLLIFQAQQHHERSLLPVAHDFITTSDLRRSDVLKPYIGKPDKVQAERDSTIVQLELENIGYKLAA